VETSLRPYFRRRYLLTKAESRFYDTLRRVVRDHIIFAKVRLADLVDADDRHRYWQANFNRVCSKHIDFVVCDSFFRPVIAVELDDSSHQREDRRKRDEDVDRVLQGVSLPLLRVFVRKAYDPDLISRLLLTKLR
jgi:hypothetical protein